MEHNMTANDLYTIANSQDRGHLKFWKAQSMIMLLPSIPEKDIHDWVANCLKMEGFSESGINNVTEALLRSLDNN